MNLHVVMCMPLALIKTKPHGVLSWPLSDETLTSWVKRQEGVVRLAPSQARSTAALSTEEWDYGELEIHDSSIDPILAAKLKLIVRWPAPFLRRPEERTAICWQCWREQWSKGLSLYRLRQWTFAWRSVCSRHGGPLSFCRHTPQRLEDWPIEETSYGADHREHRVFVLHPWGSIAPVAINIFRDRRALHLEAALDDISTSKWQPFGFNQRALRKAYATISWLLQFEFGGKEVGYAYRQRFRARGSADIPGFTPRKRLEIEYWSEPRRLSAHHMNVLAEAIISVWSDTPLPGLSAERTVLLVKSIGWGVGSVRLPLRRRSDLESKRLAEWFHLEANPQTLTKVADVFPRILQERLHQAIRHRGCISPALAKHERAMRMTPPSSESSDWYQWVSDWKQKLAEAADASQPPTKDTEPKT